MWFRSRVLFEHELNPLESEQELTLAFYNCHIEAHSNQEYVHDETHAIIELTLVAWTDGY